jgi:hypothetical protein
VVGFPDWLKIDTAEVERGKPLGKPREKLVEVEEMLTVASWIRIWLKPWNTFGDGEGHILAEPWEKGVGGSWWDPQGCKLDKSMVETVKHYGHGAGHISWKTLREAGGSLDEMLMVASWMRLWLKPWNTTDMERAKSLGKPWENLVDVDEMLTIASWMWAWFTQ